MLKKNFYKGILLIILGFFLIVLIYFDLSKDKGSSLITYNTNNVYESVDQKELLNILDNETGVVLIIDSKKDTSKLINLIFNNNINLYVYNIKNDEIILDDNNGELFVKQKASSFYNKLLNKLGNHTDKYYYITKDNKTVETDYLKIYTPMIIFIKEGKIMYSFSIVETNISEAEILETFMRGYEMIN